MTPQEEVEARKKDAQEASEKESKERATSPQERANNLAAANAQSKSDKAAASDAIKSKSVDVAEMRAQGGTEGRKMDRELRRYEQTGRMSNWLAGETLKAQAKQQAAQQSKFSKEVVIAVISNLPSIPTATKSPFTSSDRRISFENEKDITSCNGLGLFVKDGIVWISPGTIAGKKPAGMDDIDGKVIATGGSGDVWTKVVISQTTGEVVSVALTGGGDTPDGDDTTYYLTLGHYEFDDGEVNISNYGCGSVMAQICRNWFAAEEPYFGCTLSRG